MASPVLAWQQERQGLVRTGARRAARSGTGLEFEIRSIGLIRTALRRREDAPHQPPREGGAKGVIQVDEDVREALSDLASFRRVWLVFLLHRSTGWSALVKPPRGGPRRGVLATRAPNRPSQIGLTNVALETVDIAGGRVEVGGVDLLDGTPILDIKPYLESVDAHPGAGNGWVQAWIDAGIEPRLKKPLRSPD
jgi:tRNA-Thr(GGU) m(6)t(6)A37 methyltransferase TsaA